MSTALSILVALITFVSDRAKTATIVDPCPNGAVIDRVEGERVVLVHGADGVRSIAASALTAGPIALREGLRVRRSRSGQCVIEGPDRALDARVRARLRALERAGSNGRPPR